MQPVTSAIAVGANLGDAVATVARALERLYRLKGTRVRACSNLYRSAPVGPAGQPDYVNAAAVVTTRLAPLELLDALQAIEGEFGREPLKERSDERWGPRVLDLDIVTYDDRTIAEPRLAVPHPEAHHRCFVLVPLAEIAPDARIPGHGRVADLVGGCDTGEVHKLEVGRA